MPIRNVKKKTTQRKFKSRGKGQAGNVVFAKRVVHPGVRPKPVIANSIQKAKEYMISHYGKTVVKYTVDGKMPVDAMNGVLRQASKVAEKYIKENARRKTGNYVKSITLTVETQASGLQNFSVGVGVFYAAFLEEGTGRHGPKGRDYIIVPRFKKALRFIGSSGRSKSGGRSGGRGRG